MIKISKIEFFIDKLGYKSYKFMFASGGWYERDYHKWMIIGFDFYNKSIGIEINIKKV